MGLTAARTPRRIRPQSCDGFPVDNRFIEGVKTLFIEQPSSSNLPPFGLKLLLHL
jgi:hypothetical protein